MVIYYSILAYTVFFAGVGQALHKRSIGGKANSNFDSKPISLFFALVTFALLVYFVGMRTEYADTYNYINSFNKLSTDVSLSNIKAMYEETDTGIGFIVIEMLFKRYISTDFTTWFLVLAAFQAGAFVKLSYRYSVDYLLSAFLFIASTEFTWMMNGIRQYTAVCLIAYFFDLVVKRKLIPFVLVVAVAYFIHASAIVWLPVYFIVKYKPFSKQIWLFVFLTLMVVFFIDSFTNLLDSTLEGTEYAGTGNMLTSYDDGVSPIRVLVSAVAPGIALWRWKYIKEKTPFAIDIMINVSTASTGMYLLGMVTSGIMVGRIPGYFKMFDIILIPWLLKNAFGKKDGMLIKAACYLLYFVYFYYVMVIQGFGYYISEKLNLFYY